MDDHALHVLEYHTLLGGLASSASGPAGGDLIRGLRPAASREQATQRLELFGAAMAVLQAGGEFPERAAPTRPGPAE